MLEIKDLRFAYSKRGHEVLRGVSLSLEAGKTGILLGRNGAGKTTLFKALLGIVRPSSGETLLNGVPLSGMPARERARRIGYVPQQAEFGGLSVYDTVLTGRISRFGLHPGDGDHAAAAEALDEMGLAPLAQRPADELSGGEKQKVAIARALAGEPELMIFDEPTGNLDIANERLLAAEAGRLAHERGIAVLCSLHDLNEALSLGDRFFFMKDGAIKYEGGRELFTPAVIADIFGVDVSIVRAGGHTFITGGAP